MPGKVALWIINTASPEKKQFIKLPEENFASSLTLGLKSCFLTAKHICLWWVTLYQSLMLSFRLLLSFWLFAKPLYLWNKDLGIYSHRFLFSSFSWDGGGETFLAFLPKWGTPSLVCYPWNTISTPKMSAPSRIQEVTKLASSLQWSASFPFKANTSSPKVGRNRVVLGKEEVPAG